MISWRARHRPNAILIGRVASNGTTPARKSPSQCPIRGTPCRDIASRHPTDLGMQENKFCLPINLERMRVRPSGKAKSAQRGAVLIRCVAAGGGGASHRSNQARYRPPEGGGRLFTEGSQQLAAAPATSQPMKPTRSCSRASASVFGWAGSCSTVAVWPSHSSVNKTVRPSGNSSAS